MISVSSSAPNGVHGKGKQAAPPPNVGKREAPGSKHIQPGHGSWTGRHENGKSNLPHEIKISGANGDSYMGEKTPLSYIWKKLPNERRKLRDRTERGEGNLSARRHAAKREMIVKEPTEDR